MQPASPTPTADKYVTLDAWRGLAALAVVAFHSGRIMEPEVPATGWVAEVFKFGYLGVYIFFPLSGYCILNALAAGERHGRAEYFRRRVWRIYPAYWGSLLFTYLAVFAALPFNRGSLSGLAMQWWEWLGLLTLTQGFFNPGMVSSVYWTLCLEIQFYVVAGLVLFLKPSWRAAFLLLTAVLGCLYRLPDCPWEVPGLFLERWLEFLVGAAVIGWRIPWLGPAWSIAIWVLGVVTAVASPSLDLAVSLGVAWAIFALRRWDDALARLPVIKVMSYFGAFSYSLYLMHAPFMRQAKNLVLRFYNGSPEVMYWVLLVVMCAVGIVAGLVLYYLIERPCLRMAGRRKRAKPETAACF